VRACDEIQGAFALTATGRGFDANVTAGLDTGFVNSTCVSCGACADTCPTDAITEIILLDGNGEAPAPHRRDPLPAPEPGPRLRKRLPS
jgi:predicted molibdopterin-dependent oxidoreductase YjgC